MRIGILKCGQSPEVLRGDLGDYDTMFERLLAGRGFEFDSYHVEAMEYGQAHALALGMVVFAFVVLLALHWLQPKSAQTAGAGL